jgi:hypothetical protein
MRPKGAKFKSIIVIGSLLENLCGKKCLGSGGKKVMLSLTEIRVSLN